MCVQNQNESCKGHFMHNLVAVFLLPRPRLSSPLPRGGCGLEKLQLPEFSDKDRHVSPVCANNKSLFGTTFPREKGESEGKWSGGGGCNFALSFSHSTPLSP